MGKKRTLSEAVLASASEAPQDVDDETKHDEEQTEGSVGQDDGDDAEHSVYISVELTDFADFPILDKHDTLEIENLESERPILRIGEYVLYGTYEDALGTDLYYDMPTSSESATSATCSYVGSATKRLKFAIDPNEKRQFLKKPSKV